MIMTEEKGKMILILLSLRKPKFQGDRNELEKYRITENEINLT